MLLMALLLLALARIELQILVLHNRWRDYRVMLDQRLVADGKNQLTINIGSGFENSVLLANIAISSLRQNYCPKFLSMRLAGDSALPVWDGNGVCYVDSKQAVKAISDAR